MEIRGVMILTPPPPLKHPGYVPVWNAEQKMKPQTKTNDFSQQTET